MLNEMVTALRLTRSPKGKGGGRLTAGRPPGGRGTLLGWDRLGFFPMLRRCSCVLALEMRTVFALVAVVSSARAGKQCDTTHTSDLRRIWQCDDVCVHIFGNPPYYITFDGVKDGKIVRSGTFEWKKDADTASLNGKRCKKLPQTYDYD